MKDRGCAHATELIMDWNHGGIIGMGFSIFALPTWCADQVEITNEEQWEEVLSGVGLLVVDVYQKWCGPCKAVQDIFRKLRTEYGEDVLRFGVAEADSLQKLSSLRGKCLPVFLFYAGGKLVSIIRGVNGPLLKKTILDLVDQEKRKQELGSRHELEVQELFLDDNQQVGENLPPTNPENTESDEHAVYHVVIIKPQAVATGQVEEITKKVLDAGYSIVAEEERVLDEEQIRDFYKDRGEEFLKAMTSGPVHAMILSKGENQGEEDYPLLSNIINPSNAELIKPNHRCDDVEVGDLGLSDSIEMASRQLGFFPTFDYTAEMQAGKEGSHPRIQKTLALIRPKLLREKKEEILKTIQDSGFQIAMQREVMLTEEQASEFYKEHQGKDYFPALINHMTSGPVLALALTREDAIQHWRSLLGPKTLEEAKEKSPESLRAKFAIDDVSINQLHGSNSPEEAERDFCRFFPTEQTMAVIKPNSSQMKDSIIERIKAAGFSISQIKETTLTKEMAQEFYRDQKGKDFYDPLVNYMSQGPSVMMILSKDNAVAEWREMMGPKDPEEAKQLKPDSLRAQFAKSVLENAVHGASNVQHAMDHIKFIFGDNQ